METNQIKLALKIMFIILANNTSWPKWFIKTFGKSPEDVIRSGSGCLQYTLVHTYPHPTGVILCTVALAIDSWYRLGIGSISRGRLTSDKPRTPIQECTVLMTDDGQWGGCEKDLMRSFGSTISSLNRSKSWESALKYTGFRQIGYVPNGMLIKRLSYSHRAKQFYSKNTYGTP